MSLIRMDLCMSSEYQKLITLKYIIDKCRICVMHNNTSNLTSYVGICEGENETQYLSMEQIMDTISKSQATILIYYSKATQNVINVYTWNKILSYTFIRIDDEKYESARNVITNIRNQLVKLRIDDV